MELENEDEFWNGAIHHLRRGVIVKVKDADNPFWALNKVHYGEEAKGTNMRVQHVFGYAGKPIVVVQFDWGWGCWGWDAIEPPPSPKRAMINRMLAVVDQIVPDGRVVIDVGRMYDLGFRLVDEES